MGKRQGIITFETRKRIYTYVLQHPGVHLRDISRNLNLNINNLYYHIKFLERQELLFEKKIHGYSRFFIRKTVGNAEKQLLCFLRKKIMRFNRLYPPSIRVLIKRP